MNAPLNGYRVLDFGTALAGPIASALLADMGAEVIKIESRHRMDGMRMGRPVVGEDIAGGDKGKWPDLQPGFHAVNRGKRSLTVNLKRAEGVEILRSLVRCCDVVVDNFSPGVMHRLGLGYPTLRELRPDIIMVSLSGAGATGPLHEIVAYATNVAGLAGLGALIGYQGGRVLGVSQTNYCDASSGITGATAALIALWHRQRTGEGQFVDIAEWEACIPFVGEALMDHSMNRRVWGPRGNYHPQMAPYGNYPCSGEDKWISIAIETDEEWRAVCDVLGKPEWKEDPQVATRFSRLKNRQQLDGLLASETVRFAAPALAERLQQAGVAAMPVMNIEDMYFDPQYRHRQTYVETHHPLVGVEPMYGIPWKLSDTPGAIRKVAPGLGEDNEYVLGEVLGLAPSEITPLVSAEIVY